MKESFWIHSKHFLTFILIVVIVCFTLSGVFNTRNIDKLAYVVALGIDVRSKRQIELKYSAF